MNKGKSSVVATLAEDDSVQIDPRPGTTTTVREYPVRVDDRTLFVLLDTPGFEDAPRVLAWLRGGQVTAAERPARVAAFVAAYAGTAEFEEERRLLSPILAGASILYVVDGTHPFRENYEAEMEILRWTGQPGMALVNRIGQGDHAEEWHRALDQYFRIVRDFDAQAARFDDRLALLRAFRELRPDWRRAVDEALGALAVQRLGRRREAAAEIADLVADVLTHVEQVRVDDDASLAAEREGLERRFHDALRQREVRCRRRIEAIYGHSGARFDEAVLSRPILEQDLFAAEIWQVLGLSPAQLVAASAVAGATVGGALDALVGGASLLAGSVLGGALGGGTALYGMGRRFAKARPAGAAGVPGFLLDVRHFVQGGRAYRIGPHAGPNFPWVLLDRALLHYDAVVRRTHANRGVVSIGGVEHPGVVTALARDRRELEVLFRRIRRAAPDPPRAAVAALTREVLPMLMHLDPAAEDDQGRG